MKNFDCCNTLRALIGEIADFYELNIPEKQINSWVDFYSQKLVNDVNPKTFYDKSEAERKEYERLRFIYEDDEV